MANLRAIFFHPIIEGISKAKAMKNSPIASSTLNTIEKLFWKAGAEPSPEEFISAIRKADILLTAIADKSEGLSYLTTILTRVKQGAREELKVTNPSPDLNNAADQKQNSPANNAGEPEPSRSQKDILCSLNVDAKKILANASDCADAKKGSTSDDFNQDMKDYIAQYNNKTNPFLELKLTEEEIKFFEVRGLCDPITHEPMWMPVVARGKTMNLSHIIDPRIHRDDSGTRICPVTRRPIPANTIFPAMDARDAIDEIINQIKENRKNVSKQELSIPPRVPSPTPI